MGSPGFFLEIDLNDLNKTFKIWGVSLCSYHKLMRQILTQYGRKGPPPVSDGWSLSTRDSHVA